MQAINELDEVLADEQAPRNVKDAASAVRRAILDRFPPDPSLMMLVIKHRSKEQDRYGK